MLRNDTYKPWFEGEAWGVEIIDGEYSGVIVQFKSLEFFFYLNLLFHTYFKISLILI